MDFLECSRLRDRDVTKGWDRVGECRGMETRKGKKRRQIWVEYVTHLMAASMLWQVLVLY